MKTKTLLSSHFRLKVKLLLTSVRVDIVFRVARRRVEAKRAGCGKSGQIEASSSAMNVDCEGDVVRDSGSCRNDASDDAPKLFILSNARVSSLALVTSQKPNECFS